MLGRMKILATFARRAGNAPQSDLWEGRIEEMDSIIVTSGKKTAAAYARSFFSGSNGLSSQHVIELNSLTSERNNAIEPPGETILQALTRPLLLIPTLVERGDQKEGAQGLLGLP